MERTQTRDPQNACGAGVFHYLKIWSVLIGKMEPDFSNRHGARTKSKAAKKIPFRLKGNILILSKWLGMGTGSLRRC